MPSCLTPAQLADGLTVEEIAREMQESMDRVRELLQHHRAAPVGTRELDCREGRRHEVPVFARVALEQCGILAPRNPEREMRTIRLLDGRIGLLVPVPVVGSMPDDRYMVRITRKGKIKLRKVR